jgi:hypothetical protein
MARKSPNRILILMDFMVPPGLAATGALALPAAGSSSRPGLLHHTGTMHLSNHNPQK